MNVGHAQSLTESWVFEKLARHQGCNTCQHRLAFPRSCVLVEGSVNCQDRLHPGSFHIGGGINPENALSRIEEGASHVIIPSYVFNNGQMELQRLKELAHVVGKRRLVLDLSCRKKVWKFLTFSSMYHWELERR
ncbi:hypothetical protein RHSIM_Rhsim07G0247200 [Rhododendron simsii]|uniref:Phosphoribosylformimino-5-aminoimidazole carboxamide ribotide isomerase n=1 Tax=Rhododendron simsii TaxID=118357 RepID=A0A834GTJ3_RHOSS|nr:hypothetical protein RHSIM_Rhsim07G0247200 [Rhododendron simsii]